MAAIQRFVCTPVMMRPTCSPKSQSPYFMAFSISTPASASQTLRNPPQNTILRSIEVGRIPSISGDELVSDGFLEAIEELERMAREPADVLEAMQGRLSHRELHLVLVYFSQDGRDSWCALEVFDWLRKENRADGETVELMVAIMCGWVEKMVRGNHAVADVVGLLKDMECVGLTPRFSMIEKVISVYWEVGKKTEAVMFVRDMLERGVDYTVDGGQGNRGGGPTGYLAWKMMVCLSSVNLFLHHDSFIDSFKENWRKFPPKNTWLEVIKKDMKTLELDERLGRIHSVDPTLMKNSC